MSLYFDYIRAIRRAASRVLPDDPTLIETHNGSIDEVSANFISRNVSSELPTVDDGSVDPKGKLGRNHSGYLGTRNDKGDLTDDGVMNLVARDAIR